MLLHVEVGLQRWVVPDCEELCLSNWRTSGFILEAVAEPWRVWWQGYRRKTGEAGETREAGIPWREAKQIVLGNRRCRYQELHLTHLVGMGWLWALGTKADRMVGDG